MVFQLLPFAFNRNCRSADGKPVCLLAAAAAASLLLIVVILLLLLQQHCNFLGAKLARKVFQLQKRVEISLSAHARACQSSRFRFLSLSPLIISISFISISVGCKYCNQHSPHLFLADTHTHTSAHGIHS